MTKNTLQNIQIQYGKLTRKLATVGWIANGNVFRRFLIRRIAGRDKKCGPYFILTRKQEGRTVTHALNQEQFSHYSKAIATHRKVDLILRKMRKLSVKFIQLSTPKLPSRKRKKTA